jgi:hypothetical protein
VLTILGFGPPSVTSILVAAALGALILYVGITFTRWGIYQRFRYRADFGSEATVSMSEAGLQATGVHVEGK